MTKYLWLICCLFLSFNAFADVTFPIIVEEIDGSPSVVPYKIKITNGDLTDNADGTVTIDTSGAAGTPAGSDTQVQYNSSGAFAGEAGLVYLDTTNTLITDHVIANLGLESKGTAIPAGSDTQVQFNNSSVLAGDSGLTFNGTTDTLTAGIFEASLSSGEVGHVRLKEDPDNGTSYVGFAAPASIPSSQEWTLPAGEAEEDQIFEMHLNDTVRWSNNLKMAHVTSEHVIANIGIGITTNSNISGLNKHLRANIVDPGTVWDTATTICLVPQTDAALTITQIEVTLDADPTEEMRSDLMYSDVFIAHPSATYIDVLDTTSGTTSISSGFDDATVPASKCIFIRLDGQADAAITQAAYDIRYSYDP